MMSAFRASRFVFACLVLLLVSFHVNYATADGSSQPAANSDKKPISAKTFLQTCTAQADALIPPRLRSPEVSAAFESLCDAITNIVKAGNQQATRNTAAESPVRKGRELIPGLGGVMCHTVTAATGLLLRGAINVLLLALQGVCVLI